MKFVSPAAGWLRLCDTQPQQAGFAACGVAVAVAVAVVVVVSSSV